jgi:ABC-type glycerol-3-phosphate transport system permease component
MPNKKGEQFMRSKSKSERIVLISLASIWAIISLFPIWTLISVTFSKDTSNLTKTFFPNSLSNGIAKINYALDTINIWKATGDTFLYTALCIIGMLFVCSLAAYEFRFYNFPFKKLLFSMVMVSMMLPFVLYVIPLYRFVFNIGLQDTLLGVALPLMVSPLSLFIMMQFLEDMPIEVIESARIDGAGHFTIYFKIIFPLMRNGLITATVLLFIKVWGLYLWPSLITATEIRSISVAIANLLNPQFYVDPRVKIAAMLIAMIPPMLTYLFFQKYIIKGITMSSVKG